MISEKIICKIPEIICKIPEIICKIPKQNNSTCRSRSANWFSAVGTFRHGLSQVGCQPQVFV